jgi:hypothetical protein
MHDAALLSRLLSVSSELVQFTYPEQAASGEQNLQKEPDSGQPTTLDHELHDVQGRIEPSTTELQCPAYTSPASRRHNHDGR